MDTNFSGRDPVNKTVFSQTGSSQKPVQVENVQYNVQVGKFLSRVGFAFIIASASLIIITLVSAWALHGIAGQVFDFNFKETAMTERILLLIAIFVPVLPLHFFTARRLKKLIADPLHLEDIIFKKYLRQTLWVEIVMAVLCISYGLYTGLSIMFLDQPGIFLNDPDNIAEAFSTTIFYGGAFTLLALWSYSFQKMTQR
jgi:hypothetical protein